MTVVLLLLTLSALIGFGVGTSFRWPAIAASSVGIAVLSSAALQIQNFGALPGIAIVIACLTLSQMGYLAGSLRPGRLFQEQAPKEPSQDRKGDIGQQQQKPPSTTMSLLQRLQARYPGLYPDGQLRTLQRRLKVWRGQIAHELILSTSPEANSAGQHVAP
jgi:hypothetical protein